MENYGKAKKVVGMKLIGKILILSCFLLFTFFLFSVTKFFIKDFERGYSATGGKYLMLVIIAEIVLIFCAFILPYLLMKLYPNIYYYDDGFQVGKKNGKIFYEKLDYFFIPAYNRVNSFMAIRYTDNEGNWKTIPAVNYASNSFELFQQDFVNVNFPKVLMIASNKLILCIRAFPPRTKIGVPSFS